MLDDWYINNLAKIKVYAVFVFMRFSEECFTQFYEGLCWLYIDLRL